MEDDAIRDVMKLQQDVGLHSITDGELRRGSWHMDFIYEIAGVEKVEQHLKSVFHNPSPATSSSRPRRYDIRKARNGPHDLRVRRSSSCETPCGVGRRRHAEAHDPRSELGPLPQRPRRDRPRGLPRYGVFWDDLGAAYADEVRRLGEIGCTYLQFDDTSLAYLNDPEQREVFTKPGRERRAST